MLGITAHPSGLLTIQVLSAWCRLCQPFIKNPAGLGTAQTSEP